MADVEECLRRARISILGNLRLALAGRAVIVARMSSREGKGPTAWQRVRALFELTPQERLVVFGVLAAVLIGLGVRAWNLRHQKADAYEPAGVTKKMQVQR